MDSQTQATISETEFLGLLDYILIDVREPHEFDEGHLSEAENIPLNDIMENNFHFPQDQHLIVYCRSGIRSHKAMEHLKIQGFHVENLGGWLHFSPKLKTR